MTTHARRIAKTVLPASVVERIRRRRGAAARGRRGERDATPTSGEVGDTDRIVALSAQLWSSGRPDDLAALRAAVQAEPAGSAGRGIGALSVARWHLARGDVDASLAQLVGVEACDQDVRMEIEVFRVDCLCAQGSAVEALGRLSRAVGKGTSERQLTLRAGHANSLLGDYVAHGSGAMVEAFNAIYRDDGFSLVRRDSVEAPVALDNLWCAAPPAEPVESLAPVSVVTTVDEAGANVGLRSLLDQTWGNLQVIVLADHEMDLPELADERVIVVDRQEYGDLLLRAAVEHGSGTLVAMQHGEAWAHPQRIEAQVGALAADASSFGSVCSHVVVGEGLRPRPLGRIALPVLVGPHPDLAMFRADAADELESRLAGVRNHHSSATGILSHHDGLARVSERVPLVLSPMSAAQDSDGAAR